MVIAASRGWVPAGISLEPGPPGLLTAAGKKAMEVATCCYDAIGGSWLGLLAAGEQEGSPSLGNRFAIIGNQAAPSTLSFRACVPVRRMGPRALAGWVPSIE